MKRFITVIPIQEPEKLKKGIYEPVGDAPLIQKTREVRFPIFIPMENSVTDGERISVIAVMTDHDRVRTNYDTFKRELAELAEEKCFTYDITEIYTPYAEDTSTHLKLFEELIGTFNDGEELHTCVTYGTKPVPMILMMALTYAYRLCKECIIESIVYGQMNHETKKMQLFDVSSLFYMNSAVNDLADVNAADPLGFIKGMLEL